jgi:hypothetical protein
MMKDVINNDLPRMITIISKRTGTILIDIFSILGGCYNNNHETYHRNGCYDKEEAFINRSIPIQNPNDGIHPNDNGYIIIAKEIAKRIKYELDELNNGTKIDDKNEAREWRHRKHRGQVFEGIGNNET